MMNELVELIRKAIKAEEREGEEISECEYRDVVQAHLNVNDVHTLTMFLTEDPGLLAIDLTQEYQDGELAYSHLPSNGDYFTPAHAIYEAILYRSARLAGF